MDLNDVNLLGKWLQNLKEPISLGWNVESDTLFLIAFNALHLASKRRELLKELGPALELKYDNRSSNFLVPESLQQLKVCKTSPWLPTCTF